MAMSRLMMASAGRTFAISNRGGTGIASVGSDCDELKVRAPLPKVWFYAQYGHFIEKVLVRAGCNRVKVRV
jgi:hypothetical protein